MLAKPIGSHYDLRVRAIAVLLPLMPLGVEHISSWGFIVRVTPVLLPLMPLGVEHEAEGRLFVIFTQECYYL